MAEPAKSGAGPVKKWRFWRGSGAGRPAAQAAALSHLPHPSAGGRRAAPHPTFTTTLPKWAPLS